MSRDIGSRGRERMQRASAPLNAGDSPSGPEGATSDLLVLWTSIRRIAAIALKVYDVWASQAEPSELEAAEDSIKPMLEELFRHAGYGERR